MKSWGDKPRWICLYFLLCLLLDPQGLGSPFLVLLEGTLLCMTSELSRMQSLFPSPKPLDKEASGTGLGLPVWCHFLSDNILSDNISSSISLFESLGQDCTCLLGHHTHSTWHDMASQITRTEATWNNRHLLCYHFLWSPGMATKDPLLGPLRSVIQATSRILLRTQTKHFSLVTWLVGWKQNQPQY